MSRSTKSDWLEGPADLKEAIVEDVPVKGKSVKVQGLSAGYANQAQTEATETMATPDGGAKVTVNKARMEALQLLHGMIEPKLASLQEAEQIMDKFGPAIQRVIEKIDELSAIDKPAIEAAQARFPGVDEPSTAEAHANGGAGPAASGDDGPDVPVRTGAGTGDDG